MKTILIATDFSRGANNALEYAASLAKGLKAKLVIFNVYHLGIRFGAMPDYIPDAEELVNENNARLTRLSQKIATAYGIEAIGVASLDLKLEALHKEVKKQQADLVVMGINGQSPITKLMGSTTTAVLNEASYPVLIVPMEANFRGINRIVFACEYRFLSNKTLFKPLTDLAQGYKAQIQILHVEKREEFLDSHHKHAYALNMEEVLNGIKHTYRFKYKQDTLKGIEEEAADYCADMLVMVPHKKGLLESLFVPSLTKKMALHSRLPILVLPTAKKRTVKQVQKKASNQATDRV